MTGATGPCQGSSAWPCHQIVGALGLREGDDVADRLGLRREHRDPVHAEGDAAVGRRAVAEAVEEEAELLPRLLVADADDVEDPLLDGGVVQADGPTGDLISFSRQGSATDVARELTDMIQTQRSYSSNARVIQTVDEMLQETTNIIR